MAHQIAYRIALSLARLGSSRFRFRSSLHIDAHHLRVMAPVNQPLVSSAFDIAENNNMNLLVRKAEMMDMLISASLNQTLILIIVHLNSFRFNFFYRTVIGEFYSGN
jgi:hypothetical protein